MITAPLITEMMPHQTTAADKVGRLVVGALFMDMGTGKSRTAMEIVARRSGRISRVVWFTPVSLKETVRREILKHDPSASVHVFDQQTKQRDMPEAFWYVVGIESMSSSRRVILAVSSIVDSRTMIILDESGYIKNHRASRTKWITQIGLKARYRLILTGTAITQGVQDLYSQMRFLSPEILGYKSYYSFARNHIVYSEKFRGMIKKCLDVDWIAARIAPYTYQVTKDECLELPQKIYETRWFRMNDEQDEMYEKAKQEILSEIDADSWTSYAVFRAFTALQCITCGFWNRRRNGRDTEHLTVKHDRLKLLIDTVSEIPDGEKVIIWAKYRRCVEEITSALNAEFGGQACRYYGDLNEAAREGELVRFRGNERFLVATPSTGGHGLNLTEAAYVIYYTNGFKYSERIQSEDRCHRIGQSRRVTYIDIVCSDSIDERIQDALARKVNIVSEFRAKVESMRDKKTLKEAIRSL